MIFKRIVGWFYYFWTRLVLSNRAAGNSKKKKKERRKKLCVFWVSARVLHLLYCWVAKKSSVKFKVVWMSRSHILVIVSFSYCVPLNNSLLTNSERKQRGRENHKWQQKAQCPISHSYVLIRLYTRIYIVNKRSFNLINSLSEVQEPIKRQLKQE